MIFILKQVLQKCNASSFYSGLSSLSNHKPLIFLCIILYFHDIFSAISSKLHMSSIQYKDAAL